MLREQLRLEEERDIYQEIACWQKENADCGIYIWGTGSVAVGVTHALEEHGIRIAGYFTDVEGGAVDSRIASHGIPRFSLEELRHGGRRFSVVAGHSHYELAEPLRGEALIDQIWLLPSVTRSDLHLSKAFVLEHMGVLEQVYGRLGDGQSRQNMVDFLNANITMDVGDILCHFGQSGNYFSQDILCLSEEESYLDLGAYDGTSVEHFIRETGGHFRDITAVEVMPDMYCHLTEKDWAAGENVQILHVGISDHVGTDRFVMNSQSTCLSAAGEEVEVTTIDALPCREVSLIKICIGNSIRPVLLGGQETIRRQLPKLVIAAGVDNRALVEYIPLIEEIAGEGRYRFELRFTNATTDCLVLYALPREEETGRKLEEKGACEKWSGDLEDIYFGEQRDFSKDLAGSGDCGKAWPEGVDSPVFSIMMAVYNDTSLLNAAINSCLRQECHSWELLILDNSDRSQEPWGMIQNAMACDGRIRGFRSERNLGWAKGSQVLLGHARGAYVTFLSGDDCLCPGALLRIQEEIGKHDPDVVFVGNVYTNYPGGREVEYLGMVQPEYRLYAGGSRSQALVEIMKNVYYNSMFHYEKRSFLEEYGMDFFEPYYGDCATMTYAITQAERIVVLDMAAYCLTMNTSQSTGNYGVSSWDYIFASQWRSAKALFQREGYEDHGGVYYVADRIFQNYVASLSALCIGRWRDAYMNPVEGVTLPDIIEELGQGLKGADIGELFFHMGNPGFDALVKNVAVIKYFPEKEIRDAARGSWLDPLISLVLDRRRMSQGEKLKHICDFLLKEENRWCIGIYAFQELADQCGEEDWSLLRDRLEQVLQKYQRMAERFGV